MLVEDGWTYEAERSPVGGSSSEVAPRLALGVETRHGGRIPVKRLNRGIMCTDSSSTHPAILRVLQYLIGVVDLPPKLGASVVQEYTVLNALTRVNCSSALAFSAGLGFGPSRSG